MHAVHGGGGLVAAVDVEHGARITSLVSAGREWLAPSQPLAPGSPRDFVHSGTGGWDDVIPTVAACVLRDGSVLPDHGDVWDLLWTVLSASRRALVVRTELTALPIALERRMSATHAGLRLDWRASTESSAPVEFLWSAHPLLAAHPGSRMTFVGPTGGLVEEYPHRGAVIEPPATIDSLPEGRAVKAFTSGSSTAAIVHADGSSLRFDWDAGVLTHLGLYWDRGEFSTRDVMAIEPTMAPTDSAARAGTLWTIEAGRPRCWSVEVTAQHAT